MQRELGILLPGSQILTAFLVLLPFNQRFGRIQRDEQWVFLGAFVCSLVSLIFFSAPAARHRLDRPLRGTDRIRFKDTANRLILIGLGALSLGLALVTHLVVSEVASGMVSTIAGTAILLLIAAVWWSGLARTVRRAATKPVAADPGVASAKSRRVARVRVQR